MQTNVRTPSYRLHKPSGQAVATVSGRDFYLGKFDSPESHEAYGRTIAAWKAGTLVHPAARAATAAPMSIASLVARFWLHVEADGLYAKNGKPTSERSCITVALRPLLRLFGSKPAATFGPLDLQTVRRELCRPLPPPKPDEKRRRVHTGPIARASVNKHVHRIRRLFQWATSMQLVPATTWHALQSVPALRRGQCPEVRDPDRIRPSPLRAVAAVLRRIPAPVAAMIRLQWLTGMRPGEDHRS